MADPPVKRYWRSGTEFLRYGSLGLEMGVAVVIGLLAGIWLDKTFHTKPWLTIVFLLLGIAAGFKNVFKLMAEEERREKEDR